MAQTNENHQIFWRIASEKRPPNFDMSYAICKRDLIEMNCIELGTDYWKSEEVTESANPSQHNIENVHWGKYILAAQRRQPFTRHRTSLQIPSQSALEDVDWQNRLINQTQFQREDSSRVVKRLGLTTTHPWSLSEMRAGHYLKFWQAYAVEAILSFRDNQQKGCLLADATGLGKTWVLIGYLLRVDSSSVLTDGNR